jgi:hypothetical protein
MNLQKHNIKTLKFVAMRKKEFFIRTGFIVPIALWSVFIFMVLFGIISSIFGAESAFYCTVYCKMGAALLGAAIAGVVYCQARACWKN